MDTAAARTSHLLGMPVPVAAGAAAALAALVVLAAVAAAAYFARRRAAGRPSLSRVEHAPSSASGSGSGSSRPASSARKDKAGNGADRVAGAGAGASTSDAASSSAAASSLESPVKRKAAEAVRAAGGAAAGVEMGWGRWYELAELEVATGGFCAENVVGEGGYGMVYRGVLAGGEVVAVKDLFDHK